MTPAEIGQIVRAARKAQGLRQDQLAGAAGVGVRFVSELERGKATVRLEKVLAVLDTLGCTVRVELPGGATATSEGAGSEAVAEADGADPQRFSYE
ncbi:MAG: helix-turn-helix transcriptional regulator [Gemmatimonadetes bacterium]|nr:helix-turn-helix transcriptional regulator [Gemmatimonadota bacterium]